MGRYWPSRRSVPRTKSVAIGGGADMDDRATIADSDANDP